MPMYHDASRYDETYLQSLCTHLATHRPRPGRWHDVARRWHHRPESWDGDQLLAFTPAELRQCADAAQLPWPGQTGDPVLTAVHRNSLSVVLAAGAELAVHEGGHLPGGVSVGDVLNRCADRTAKRFIVEGVGDAKPRAFISLMYRLRGPYWCDLRTVAALAYCKPVSRGTATLLESPAGPWPGHQDGSWEPAEALAEDVYTPGVRQRQGWAAADTAVH